MRHACRRPPLAPLLAALLGLPLSAAADDFLREGWYLGGRGVYTQVDFDTQGVAQNDFGFNLVAGYRISKYLASDFEFEYIDAIPVDGKPGPNFDVRTFDLAWMFRLYPLSFAFDASSPLHRVQPYLAAGPAWQWVALNRFPGNDRNRGGFAGRLGGGLDVYLTENLSLNADATYVLSTGDVSDYRYLSIGWGFAYHFGPEEGGGGGGGGGSHEDEEEEGGAGSE